MVLRSKWRPVLVMGASLLLLVPNYSQQPAKISAASLPGDALALSWADCLQQPLLDRPYLRYVWVKDASDAGIRCVSLMLNIASRATTIRRPVPIKGERATVVRFDLRWLVPREKDLRQWLDLWEDFQYDPDFSTNLTKGVLELAQVLLHNYEGKAWVTRTDKQLVDCEPYIHPQDGKEYTKRWHYSRVRRLEITSIKNLKAQDVEVVRLPGHHLEQKLYLDFVNHIGSFAPVVSEEYLGSRLLHTIRDDGLFDVLYGGRYYDFAGIPTTKDIADEDERKKASDEDALYLQLGLALNLSKGVNAAKLLDQLRSDRRAAKWRSDVTGGPRRIDVFRTGTGLVDETTSLISVTHDLRQKNIDLTQHPLANLLKFQDDAREVIFERANGLHGYAMYDGQGKRQDEVPFDVANDRTIPAPHPPRLDSQSCISCHETEGSDGWKVVTNDVKRLVGAFKKLDLFGDLGAGRKALDPDTLDRLHSLYSGDPERALQRGRDDYARAVLAATGPWPEAAEKAQTNIVKIATSTMIGRLRSHRYQLVTPETALLSLGIKLADPVLPTNPKEDEKRNEQAVKLLNELLPPDTRATVKLQDHLAGVEQVVIPEDPRIAALKAGISINRYDWDQAYSFAAERAQRTLAAVRNRPPVKINN